MDELINAPDINAITSLGWLRDNNGSSTAEELLNTTNSSKELMNSLTIIKDLNESKK